MINRRQLLTGVVGGLLASVMRPRHSSAQPTGLVPLNDRLSLVTSGASNVLALSAGDGLVIVDSGAPEYSDRLITSLRQLSGGHLVSVFNTHWHLENTGANDLLRQAGANVIAHENTRLWMATPTWIPSEDRYRPARSQMAKPEKTFRVDGSMNAGGDGLDYDYLL